jgi:Flp pilus assembly protein TadD
MDAQRLEQAESLYQAGVASQMRGDLAAAVPLYKQVVDLVPQHPYAWSNLGVALKRMGQYKEAVEALSRAAALLPQNPAVLSNLGAAMNSAGDTEAAIDVLLRALEIQPDHIESLLTLGGALHDNQELEDAVRCFDRVVALQPENAEAHWGLAMSLLRLGIFPRGWKEFEWRLRMPRLNLRRDFRQPQWFGENIGGKTVLLHAEGGFGDAIQFIRLAPQVQGRGAKLILECQPDLVKLLAPVPGISGVFRRGDPLPSFDYQVPLQSLPLALGTTLETIPSQIPYLAPGEESQKRWKDRFAGDSSFKVGLVWAGSESSDRSRDLKLFAALAAAGEIRFFSVQKGPEGAQKPPAEMNWADYTSELTDFSETAALLEQLDLLVTVDTAAAHLAGAIGKPVWVLIPARPDFRWLRGRADSPWYPTMRLFHQETLGDWKAPVAQMAEALGELVKTKQANSAGR